MRRGVDSQGDEDEVSVEAGRCFGVDPEPRAQGKRLVVRHCMAHVYGDGGHLLGEPRLPQHMRLPGLWHIARHVLDDANGRTRESTAWLQSLGFNEQANG